MEVGSGSRGGKWGWGVGVGVGWGVGVWGGECAWGWGVGGEWEGMRGCVCRRGADAWL